MKTRVLLAAIVFAGIIPFSSRAIFMDEHIFLKIAQSAQTNWLFPSDTPGMFFGTPVPNFAAHTHPPVGEYFLAIVYALLGNFTEVPFRLAFAIFPIVAVLAFYSLAKRFTAHPLLVSLLFALSPAFFVMSSTLMMDIPMLAFLLSGMAFYFGQVQSGRKGLLAAAGACFILAAGTGYTALVPLCCLFVGLVAARRPARELLALAAAPAVLAVWLILMTIHFGTFPLVGVVQYYAAQVTTVFHTAPASLSFLGGVALFPWVLAVPLRTVWTSLAAAGLISAFLPFNSVGNHLLFFVLSGFGIALLQQFTAAASQLIKSGKNSGEAFLIIWLPATMLFFVVVADMINARYILLLLPPLFLFLFRQSSIRQLSIALVPTAILSLSVAYADFGFVNSYRTWVDATIPPLQQQGFRVWSAAESGLRFNLERKGVLALTAVDVRPTGPDLIVSQEMFRYSLSDPVATMLTILKTFKLEDAFPLRTFNKVAEAGFHDSRMGLLPYTFSRAPYDTVEIAQVSPFAAHLPPADNNPAWSPGGVIFKQSEPEQLFRMRVPSQTTLEYEIEAGDGAAEITGQGIRLRKGQAPVTVWKAFRIAPTQFTRERD